MDSTLHLSLNHVCESSSDFLPLVIRIHIHDPQWFLSDSSESEGVPEGFADIRVREISTGRGLPEREIKLSDLAAAAEAAFD